MSNKIIKKDELKDLLIKASELSEKEKKELSDQYTLQEIKEIAWEYDIDSSKIEAAYKALADRKEMYQLGMYIAICLILIGSVTAFALWPRPFTGKLELTLTSDYHANTMMPKDQLKALEIYRHNQHYALISIYNMEYTHSFRLEIIDPDGKIKKQKETEIYGGESKSDEIEFYIPLNLPIGATVGDWRYQIFIDDELYLERKVPVSYGAMNISFASELYSNGKPVKVKSVFHAEEDQYVECYVFWPVLSGEHLLEWKWYAPNGEMYKHHSINLEPVGGKSYWAWHHVEAKELQSGRWRVELYMASVKVGEKEFIMD
ncbi:MAG: hypothetical protein ACPGJS_21855 [Flammeovirgaceae bacterium]